MKTPGNTRSRFNASICLSSFLGFMLVCIWPSLATAQETDTLEKVRKSHTLVLGVRDNNLPFSTLSQGMATGYAIDLCNKIVDQMRKELKVSDLRVQYVAVTAADRITKLNAGTIDMECGQTVNTQSRAAEVGFSYSHFISGQRFLTKKDSGISDYTGLAGKSVAVVKGSTGEKLFTQLRDASFKTMKLETFNNNQEAMKALESGKVIAFVQVDITLDSARLQSSKPDDFVMSQNAMSVEPMALMFRKNDAQLKTLVNKTLENLYNSGDINGIYDRWFNSGNIHVPMSQMLKECIRRPCRDSGVALGLGYLL